MPKVLVRGHHVHIEERGCKETKRNVQHKLRWGLGQTSSSFISRGTNPADALMLNFWPPEIWEICASCLSHSECLQSRESLSLCLPGKFSSMTQNAYKNMYWFTPKLKYRVTDSIYIYKWGILIVTESNKSENDKERKFKKTDCLSSLTLWDIHYWRFVTMISYTRV